MAAEAAAPFAGTLPASEVTMQTPAPTAAVRPSGPGATQIRTSGKTGHEGFTAVDHPQLPTPVAKPSPFASTPLPVSREPKKTGHEGFTSVDRPPIVAGPPVPLPSRVDEPAPPSRVGKTVVDDNPVRLPSRSSGRTARPLGGFLVSFQYEPLGTFWPLAIGLNLVGRAGGRPDLEVGIADATVSGEQATIEVQSTGISLTDRGSTNGTFVNGRQLPSGGKAMIGHGDQLRFGSFETIVVVVPYPAGTRG